jgi:hypothetical protein
LFAVETVTVDGVAKARRPVTWTSLTTEGAGGIMKSFVDTAVPNGVATHCSARYYVNNAAYR